MKEVLFVSTLVLFVIAGVGSAVLVATDWNDLASGDSFAGLGFLLFLIGAGIGAVFVLTVFWILAKRRNHNKEAVQEAIEKTPDFESEKTNKDDVKGSYNIHVHHMQEAKDFKGIRMSDASLLNKLGLGVKQAFRKVSLRMMRWDSDSSDAMFSTGNKMLNKRTQSMDTTQTPTPRIYVLPPESLTGGSITHMHTFSHSRSRSGIPMTEKLGMPDATILDMETNLKDVEEDIETGTVVSYSSSAMSDLSPREVGSVTPRQATSLALPNIHLIDNHLDYFVQTLNQSENRLTYMLSIMIEEVLPRPDSGLLKRMLRMSEIPVGVVEGSGEPILHLRIGSECHVSIGLIKINGEGSSVDISGPHSIKLKPLDGEEMLLNTTCEAVDEIEHVSSAIWDLKSHTSDSLTRVESGDSASTLLTPIEMTLGFHVHYNQQGDDFIKEVEVKRTFMASMRRELVSLDVDQRLKHEDVVLDFVLTQMELISMPSLLMFLEVDTE